MYLLFAAGILMFKAQKVHRQEATRILAEGTTKKYIGIFALKVQQAIIALLKPTLSFLLRK